MDNRLFRADDDELVRSDGPIEQVVIEKPESRRTLSVVGHDLEAAFLCDDGCSQAELCELMKLRGADARDRIIADYGGVEQLCQRLSTHPDNGLNGTPDDIQRRRQVHGSNDIKHKPMKNFLFFIWEAWWDATMVTLTVAAIISFGLSFYKPSSSSSQNSSEDQDSGYSSGNVEWIDGVAILIAVVVVTTVTAFNDWSKEVQFRGLKKTVDEQHQFTVIRNSQTIQLSVKEIVVGDICRIKYGDILPADGFLVHGTDVRVDESTLTGESDLTRKSMRTDPVLLSGTFIMEGSGKMVVTAVGINSQAGKILKLLGLTDDGSTRCCAGICKSGDDDEADDTARSVLRSKLDRLTVQIGYIGFTIAVITFTVLILRFCIETFVVQHKPWENVYLQHFVDFFITSITILVIAIPEGLPVAVMVSLAYSVKQMTKDNNLVRHLYACETMGNATAICSDKTGTLTTNRMTVVQVYVADRLHSNVSDCRLIPASLKSLLTTSIAVNTNYTSRIVVNSTNGFSSTTHVGNKTECALLAFCLELGFDYEQLRQLTPEQTFLKVYTFNSVRKSMSTVVPRSDGSGFHVFTKGASEVLLQRCSWIVDRDGTAVPLTDDRRAAITKDVIRPMAIDGLRTLCLTYKNYIIGRTSLYPQPEDVCVEQEPDWDDETEITSHLVCLCVVGIEDPVRPEVPEAIRQCQQAGITVRMVTGDNINTAKSIALKCGILTSDSDFLVLDGTEFNARIRDNPTDPVDQDRLDALWPRLRVLARSTPEDKYNLVKGIMQSRRGGDGHQQEVVAVTGDGTNDAPALKKADVGFAMGIAGTDIAKEACDIILIDDNFASIVKAVMWGRHVYDSIAKFLQFQLTVNVVAVTLAFIGSCVVTSSPIKAVQMMWVNLLQDTLASLSLATERPSDSLLKRRPYGRNQSLVSQTMFVNIIGHSVYQLVILFAFLFAGELFLDVDSGRVDDFTDQQNQHYTFIFNVLVMMTLFNEINARKIDGSPNVFESLHRSHLFQIIWTLSFVLQIIIIQVGGNAFFTVPLTLEQWFWCLFFGISELLFGQVISVVSHVVCIKCRCAGVATLSSNDDYNFMLTSVIRTEGLSMTYADRQINLPSELQINNDYISTDI